MWSGQQFWVALLALLLLLYVVFLLCRTRDEDDDPDEDEDERRAQREPFAPATAAPYDLQAAIDFSDVTTTPEQRAELAELQRNARQIQTVDERFEAAKRKPEEHGMHPGIMPLKKRRQVVESLVRRPFCGRRTRSWRTEFSDNLRGDVVPKMLNNNLGIMRVGRSDPSIDLHPGALGQMSGSNGRWLSTQSVPENAFTDMEPL